MLYGFRRRNVVQGAIVAELALSSVVLAVLIGLVGAGAKLSQNFRITGLIFGKDTPPKRGADLVLMLLIFYGCKSRLTW